VARVLRPGGHFLQELASREALVRDWHDSRVLRNDEELVVVQERDGGPLELDSSFVVTLSARAGKGS
jgi:hypothetical protein